eukprot:10118005-Alexandrium_andersonii.AAC.1
MRRHIWVSIGKAVPVRLHARDLGAHASFSKRMVSGTLAQRMMQVRTLALQIACLPAGLQRRCQAVRSKLIPKALYGVEATPASGQALKCLRSSVKRALHVGTMPMANPGLLFCSWGKGNPDPLLRILVSRAKKLRAMFHTSTQWQCDIIEVLRAHIGRQSPGVCRE